jgi:3-dehydroquinate synthase
MSVIELDSLRIASAQWDYDVEFSDTIAGALHQLSSRQECFIVCDVNVYRLHEAALAPLCKQFPSYVVEATEETKSLAGVQTLVDWLIENRAVRSATLIAIGGGTIQDLVGFTAHIYYRGVDWFFLPTTVLSQADSCIGAKTGINVLPFKNQLGVLHSPKGVAIVSEFLETLPDIEVASGYGEIVKLSVTSSHHFLDRLELGLASGGIRNPMHLELTHSSLVAKKEIIELDEYESDLRRILNYGHSFGHALEACSNHAIPHGLAVLWGITVINWLGCRWGMTDPQTAQRLEDLIRNNFDYRLPLKPEPEDLLEMLSRDKKVSRGQMNFAVLNRPGEFSIAPRALDDALRLQVQEYLSTDYVFRSS